MAARSRAGSAARHSRSYAGFITRPKAAVRALSGVRWTHGFYIDGRAFGSPAGGFGA